MSTLGKIAHQAWLDGPGDCEQAWDVSAKAVRAVVIDEVSDALRQLANAESSHPARMGFDLLLPGSHQAISKVLAQTAEAVLRLKDRDNARAS
jgi:hypothetical protein